MSCSPRVYSPSGSARLTSATAIETWSYVSSIDCVLGRIRSDRCRPAVQSVSAPSRPWSGRALPARSSRRRMTSRPVETQGRRLAAAVRAAVALAVVMVVLWRRRPREDLPTAASRPTRRCRRTWRRRSESDSRSETPFPILPPSTQAPTRNTAAFLGGNDARETI